MKLYKVGGCVRDKLMGINPNDYDFTFVATESSTLEEGFLEMETSLKANQFTIFLSTPEMGTIRAKFPTNHKNKGMVADFVLARKEVGYLPRTRRPILELGTLEDDLIRRDFTVNSIAEDDEGNIIDPLNGRKDLEKLLLRTTQSPDKCFNDDPLRILRALRFSITKNFEISSDISKAITFFDYNKFSVVSAERTREELTKCFKYDSLLTIRELSKYQDLCEYVFEKISLRAEIKVL